MKYGDEGCLTMKDLSVFNAFYARKLTFTAKLQLFWWILTKQEFEVIISIVPRTTTLFVNSSNTPHSDMPVDKADNVVVNCKGSDSIQ